MSRKSSLKCSYIHLLRSIEEELLISYQSDKCNCNCHRNAQTAACLSSFAICFRIIDASHQVAVLITDCKAEDATPPATWLGWQPASSVLQNGPHFQVKEQESLPS